jgi:thioredoxin 1
VKSILKGFLSAYKKIFPLEGIISMIRTNKEINMSDRIISATDTSFEKDVLKSDKPVLVDFWAEWCQPCQRIAPILEELSQEMSDTIRIAKVNIDQNPETPTKYGVRGIPTLLLIKNGEVIGTKVGFVHKSMISEWINSTL